LGIDDSFPTLQHPWLMAVRTGLISLANRINFQTYFPVSYVSKVSPYGILIAKIIGEDPQYK